MLRNYRGWRTRKCEPYEAKEKGESESRKNAKETAKEEKNDLRKLGRKLKFKKRRRKMGEETILGELYGGNGSAEKKRKAQRNYRSWRIRKLKVIHSRKEKTRVRLKGKQRKQWKGN